MKKIFDDRRLRRLMRAVAKGRYRALHEFYDLYGRGIYMIAKAFCRTHEDADETVNDVLVKVWDHADVIAEYENPLGWIYRVTVNSATDKVRRQSHEDCLLSDDIPDWHDGYAEVDDSGAFSSYMRQLTERERMVMIYKFVFDYTFGEIAKIMSSSVSTITSLYYRALKKIKENL